MDALYPYALLIHLICAIIFVGYLFFDVVIFSRAKKLLDPNEALEVSKKITSKAIKIMPICVLLLLLTGGIMASRWLNSEVGFLDSSLQIILIIKIIAACLIFLAVAINLSCKFIFKRPSPLGNIHPIALILAAIIIICAKAMFYL